MIRNIIFDWSGTLVDDLPAVWQATNFVLRQAGLAEFTLEQFRSEFSLPFENFYNRFTPHIPPKQLEELFHSHFRQVQDNVCELPHAREFLHLCKRRGLRTFLLSAVHSEHFERQAASTGFQEYLDRPYLGVWDKRARIHALLEENGLEKSETLFIGDMQHDIDTAKHGGIFSCAVLTGYNSIEQLRKSSPDLIVEHLGELKQILEKNEWHLPGHCPASQPVATVGALIFNERGHVLMIRTHKWSNLWGIPGGKIEFGERSEEALRRELKEETNLDIERIEFVLVQDCIHSKEFYRDAHFVLLNFACLAAGNQEVRLNAEAEEFRWLSPGEALALDLNQPTRRLLERWMASQETSPARPDSH